MAPKYQASVTSKGKIIELGRFDTKEQCYAAIRQWKIVHPSTVEDEFVR